MWLRYLIEWISSTLQPRNNKRIINWSVEWVSSSSFFTFVNGHPTQNCMVSRGWRQGDTFSPFLFTITMERLSLLMKEKIEWGILGSFIANGTKVESHLLFLYYIVVFTTHWRSLCLSPDNKYDRQEWNHMCRRGVSSPNLNGR